MSDLFRELDAEWEQYVRRREVRRFMDRLGADPRLRFPSADALVRAIRENGRRDPQAADDLLLGLMRIAPGEPVAQRIILQPLIAGLCAMAQRVARRAQDGVAVDIPAELLSLAGLRIASYPLERRPGNVAANILRDVERDFHRHRFYRVREMAGYHPPGFDRDDGAGELPDPRAPIAFATIEARIDVVAAINQGRAAGVVVADRDFSILVRTRVRDEDVGAVGQEYDVTAASARRARNRVECRLAAFCARAEAPSVAA